ncbi:MAG: hypothetical protein R3F11_05890 [Verrucomicrobiales bacterium]
MPFTPFHFGLAALPGGAISRWCSFRLFCFANAAIDVEALYRLPLGLYPYHHWCHTYLIGPALCAALAIPVARSAGGRRTGGTEMPVARGSNRSG